MKDKLLAKIVPGNGGGGVDGGEAAPITNPVLRKTLQGKSGLEFLQELIPNLVGLAFIVGVIIFLFVMILGAIQWITSGGDKTSIESARGRVTNAVIGIFFLLATFAILKLIENFFGIDILTLDIGPLKIE